MSSIEIADLTEKNHGHVIRDIKALLISLYAPGASFEDMEKDDPVSVHLGNSVTWEKDSRSYVIVFHLDREHTLTLISGYDARLRMKIIKRWADLEAGAKFDPMKALNDPAAMRGLLLTYTEKVIALEEEVGHLLPKAAAHDRIADSFGSTCRRIAAKNLGIPPLMLNRWMRTNGWTYKLQGSNDDLAYQSKISAGFLEHKVETGERPDGTSWSRTSVRVTPKGMLALAKAFPPAAKEVAA